MLTRVDRYKLTVSTWFRAVEADVKPERAPCLLAEGPQFYEPHCWLFAGPPTREDWWELCRVTPWMFCFEKHREVIDANPWPLILPGFKRAWVDLNDLQGREVGRIEVDREWCYSSTPYCIPFYGVDTSDRILRSFRGESRDRIASWLSDMRSEYQVVEEAMRRASAKGKDVTEEMYVTIGKELACKLCQAPKPAAEMAVV